MDYPNPKTVQSTVGGSGLSSLPPPPRELILTQRGTSGPDPTTRAMDTISALKRGEYGVDRMQSWDYDQSKTIDQVREATRLLRFMRILTRLHPWFRVIDLMTFILGILRRMPGETVLKTVGYQHECHVDAPTWTPPPSMYHTHGAFLDGLGPCGAELLGQTWYTAMPPGLGKAGFNLVSVRAWDAVPGYDFTFITDKYTALYEDPPTPQYVRTPGRIVYTTIRHSGEFRDVRKLEWVRRQLDRIEQKDFVHGSSSGYSTSTATGTNSRTDTMTGWGGAQDTTPPYHREPPRGPGDREVKLKVNAAIMASLRVINAVYGKLLDFKDIVKALHDSLPKEMQNKIKKGERHRLSDLIEAIMRNPGHMDPTKAFLGVIKELAEDRVGGFSAQLRAEIGQLTKRLNTGFNTGFGL